MTVTETRTGLPAASAPSTPRAGAVAPSGPAAGRPAATSRGVAAVSAAVDELTAANRTQLTPELDEIGRRAAHLAAFQRAVQPVAETRLDGSLAQTAEWRRSARDLARALHWLDRHLTGDGRLAGWPSERVRQHAQLALARYHQAERALVDALSDALDAAEMAALAQAYHRGHPACPDARAPAAELSGTGWPADLPARRHGGRRA